MYRLDFDIELWLEIVCQLAAGAVCLANNSKSLSWAEPSSAKVIALTAAKQK